MNAYNLLWKYGEKTNRFKDKDHLNQFFKTHLIELCADCVLRTEISPNNLEYIWWEVSSLKWHHIYSDQFIICQQKN